MIMNIKPFQRFQFCGKEIFLSLIFFNYIFQMYVVLIFELLIRETSQTRIQCFKEISQTD